MQTLPTFVYLIPVLTLFGLGNAPGLIVTIIFVIPTAVRLTHLGMTSVPKAIIEAGEAFGATKRQLLWKVELPVGAADHHGRPDPGHHAVAVDGGVRRPDRRMSIGEVDAEHQHAGRPPTRLIRNRPEATREGSARHPRRRRGGRRVGEATALRVASRQRAQRPEDESTDESHRASQRPTRLAAGRRRPRRAGTRHELERQGLERRVGTPFEARDDLLGGGPTDFDDRRADAGQRAGSGSRRGRCCRRR